MTNKERIFLGIAEILAGMITGDLQRSEQGQAMVEAVFDNLPATTRDVYNQINLAAAEIEVGTRVGDPDRVGWGWAVIEDALLALDGLRAKDRDLLIGKLMELHKSALTMWETAWPYLVATQDSDKFIAARTLHQNCLANLAGGGRNETNDCM